MVFNISIYFLVKYAINYGTCLFNVTTYRLQYKKFGTTSFFDVGTETTISNYIY